MTIKKLIDKMNKDGHKTHLLKYFYEELIANINTCKQMYANGEIFVDTRYYNNIDTYHYKINGYLWALVDTYYILTDEANDIEYELLELEKIIPEE